MSRVEFEPMIPVLERTRTFRALNCTATVTDKCRTWKFEMCLQLENPEIVGILNTVSTSNTM
jgi:hypothetical protein